MTKIDTSTEAVERLLENVTPGPWWVEPEGTIRNDADGNPRWDLPRVVRHSAAGQSICKTHLIGDKEPDPAIANARFIAAARDLVPALLKERDEARAALNEAVETLLSSRETHVAIADHCLEHKQMSSVSGIFADSQRARLAIDATLAKIKGADHE